MPKISVVMNCYNSGTFLREAIDSVLAQTMPDWEIVFWDNQSTDDSAAIVKSYTDDRIRYHYAPGHVPLGKARNLAAAEARGEWLAFLDCDDRWRPEKLGRQLELIEENPEKDIAIVYSRAQITGGRHDGVILPTQFSPGELPEGRIIIPYLLEGNFIPLVAAMMRRDAFWAVGGIPEHYRQAEDYYILAAIAARYAVAAVPEVTCDYRVHGNNVTHKQFSIGMLESSAVVEQFWPANGTDAQQNARKQQILAQYAVWEGLAMIREKRGLAAALKTLFSRGARAALGPLLKELSRQTRGAIMRRKRSGATNA